MLENLKKEVRKEIVLQYEKDVKYFQEKNTMEEKEEYIKRFFYSKSIQRLYKKANAKTEKQKEKVLISLIKNYFIDSKNKKIKKIEEAIEVLKNYDLISISISIDWVKNNCWGYNHHCHIITTYREKKTGYKKELHTSGTASGCGYDKRSAATGDALDNNIVLAFLYKFKNKQLKNNQGMPYGAGYGALPYFSGGVGFSCHSIIIENLGLKCQISDERSKNHDYYFFSKIGA